MRKLDNRGVAVLCALGFLFSIPILSSLFFVFPEQAQFIDLKVRGNDEGWKDGVTSTWTLADMKPGDTVFGMVAFKNVGNVQADHLEIACDYYLDDPPGPESDAQEGTLADCMADQLIILEIKYFHDGMSIDLLSRLRDSDGDGVDLLELKNQGLDDLPPPDGDGDERLDMTLKFCENAGNDFQGDTFVLAMIFTLRG